MDPNVTLRYYFDSLDIGEDDIAEQYAQDLRDWVLRGGFEPDWSPEERRLILGDSVKAGIADYIGPGEHP